MRQLHHETYLNLTRLKAEVGKSLDIEATTDAIGVLKKSFDLIKDLKMEVDKCVQQLEKVTCALYIRSSSIGEPIRGQWVTGTPGGKSRLKLPPRNSPQYDKFLSAVGIAPSAIDSGMVRLHWPSVQEYLNVLEEQGKPMPPGIEANESETEFGVRCLFHRDVDLDTLCEGEANVDGDS